MGFYLQFFFICKGYWISLTIMSELQKQAELIYRGLTSLTSRTTLNAISIHHNVYRNGAVACCHGLCMNYGCSYSSFAFIGLWQCYDTIMKWNYPNGRWKTGKKNKDQGTSLLINTVAIDKVNLQATFATEVLFRSLGSES